MNKIIYLDAAASSLKPDAVITAEMDFLQNRYANAGRGICNRGSDVDQMIIDSRQTVADFIKARPDQIVFTSGTTDGLNRLVRILDASNAIPNNANVIVSDLDHHSARLPWEELATIGKCQIEICPMDNDFNLNLIGINALDVFIITAMSNVFGTPQPVQDLITAAKTINPNVITIVDAAQYVAHLPIDVTNWGADFVCFSGHKIGADTGIGVLYIKEPMRWAVDKLGGGMVAHVREKSDGINTGSRSEWMLADAPGRFEAGTLPITQIVGLGVAIKEMKKKTNTSEIMKYLYSELAKIKGICVLTKPDASILTFVVDGMHCFDFGSLMGAHGVCLRVGTMCASWAHKALGVAGTIRISAGAWNTMDEAMEVIGLIKKVQKVG